MSRVVSFAVTLLMIGTLFSSVIGFDILEQRDTSYFSGSNNQNPTVNLSTWVINPESGPFDSGTEVTISGSGFSSFHSWTNTTVDSGGGLTGMGGSLAVDSSGDVHISYAIDTNGNDLKYATYDGSSWTYTTVDSAADNCPPNYGCYGVGSYSSLAVDSSGDVHISYIDDTSNGALKYATYDGSSWTNTTVDSVEDPENGSSGGFADTSLTIDPNGDVHISYIDFSTHELKYTTYDGSSWTTSIVGSGGAWGDGFRYPSLAVDSSGDVHIAYVYRNTTVFDEQYLKYATYDGSSWTYTTVDHMGTEPSLVVDSSGVVHISYMDETRVSNEMDWMDLKYATYDGSSWTNTTIDREGRVGYFSSLAVDSSGNVHISYAEDTSNGGLKYATYDGNSWINITVDSSVGILLQTTSLAIDSNGDVHISYAGRTNNFELKYATLSGSNSSGSANEITVQFGDYGNVIGTIVDDATITVTAPQGGCSGEVVDITLWHWNGTGYVLSSAFTYLIPDIDNDGICDMFDSDRDGDGFENIADAFPDDGNENNDTDSDGYGDNGDACPNNHGTSHIDRNGCIDQDGDGVSDLNDAFWMFSSVSAPLSTVMLRVMIVLTVIVAGIVVMIKRRRIKSEEDTSPSNVSIGREQVVAIPESQAEQTQSQVISEYQQWTDEQGHTWRRFSDGRTELWNGTDWQEA